MNKETFTERAADKTLNDEFVEFVREYFSLLPDDFKLYFTGQYNKSSYRNVVEFYEAYEDWKKDLGKERMMDIAYALSQLTKTMNIIGKVVVDVGELRQAEPEKISAQIKKRTGRGISNDMVSKIQLIFTPFSE